MAESFQERFAETPDHEYVVFDPVAYAHAMWARKGLLVAAPLLAAAVLYGLSYLPGKTYRSELKFMPPKPTGGPLISFGKAATGDEYRAELSSRTVGMDVARHLHLADRLKLKDDETAWRMASGSSKFTTDANNFITITVTTNSPELSADIANEYYAALNRFLENLSVREAEHRLNYMAGPMQAEQGRMEAAEDALQAAQQNTGLVLPSAQANLGVQAVATMRARVSELEAQLASLRQSSTDANPAVVTLRSQIGNLQSQIHTLESKNGEANSPANLPKLSLEVTRRQREVELHNDILSGLAKSVGVLQTSESYTPSLSLVDPAIPIKQKYSPQRRTWAEVGFLLGVIFALVRIFLGTAYREWSLSARGTVTRSRWSQSWQRRSGGLKGHAR